MSCYRPREAGQVFVTGTFDNWEKTVQLERKGNGFEKEVYLPNISEKIQYKVRWLCILDVSLSLSFPSVPLVTHFSPKSALSSNP